MIIKYLAMLCYMFQDVLRTKVRFASSGDPHYQPPVHMLFPPSQLLLLCEKQQPKQLFIREHEFSLLAFLFYFVPLWSTWSGIHKLQSCLEKGKKKTGWKPSVAKRLRSYSSLLVSPTLSDYLASAFKVLIEPQALPRSAVSCSFLLPVRENAREVQRVPCSVPNAGNLTASGEGAE